MAFGAQERAGSPEDLTIRRLQPVLGTWVEIRATGRAGRVERAVASAFLHIARVQRRMSFHAPDSALSRINLHAHHTAQRVDAWTWDVLRKARALSRASEGCFDITLGARLVARGVLPDHGFASLRAPIGADAVVLLPGRRVTLRRPVLLTLDGIAKGYAVDLAIQCLKRAGVRQAVVNAGGDLRVFGADSVPLAVRGANGVISDAGVLRNAAVASSALGLEDSDSERFPGCVLHPSQGHAGPSQASLAPSGGGSVSRPRGYSQKHAGPPQVWTVQAPACWRADALTKVAALAAPGRRHILVSRLGGRILQSGQGIAQGGAA
jgi:thiamine biosynthesis lipoprotein